MFKRLVVLCLALILSVAVIACTKKIDTEVSSSETGSFVDKGVPGSTYDEGDELTSSELEQLESEILNSSNVEIVIPNNSSDASSGSSNVSSGNDSTPTSSSDITGFY